MRFFLQKRLTCYFSSTLVKNDSPSNNTTPNEGKHIGSKQVPHRKFNETEQLPMSEHLTLSSIKFLNKGTRYFLKLG